MKTRTMAVPLMVIFLMLFAGIAVAAPAFPDGLKREFSQYPGSNVLQVSMVSGTQMTTLDCGNTPVEKIYAYYKKKAVDNGWQVMMETMQEEVTMFMAQKGAKAAVVTVGKDEGKTMVNLGIYDN